MSTATVEQSAKPSSLAEHEGEPYLSCLTQMHELLRPRTYLEIGVNRGQSLRLAQCAAIGVDPKFLLDAPFTTELAVALCLFQMRSDTFFASYDPRAILGAPLDFAFLDGMHLSECLLRDFMHTEKCCHQGSVIALHDCLPLDLHMAARDVNDSKRRSLSAHRDWWTGDVWKILLMLKQYRPDLRVQAFNAPPTGLVIVQGLDPGSRVLEDCHDEMIQQFRNPQDEAGMFAELLADLEIKDTTRLTESLTTFR